MKIWTRKTENLLIYNQYKDKNEKRLISIRS